MTDYERWFESAREGEASRLSERGKARRREMGAHLVGAVVRRRRQRMALRAGAAAALLAALAVLAWPSRDPAPERTQDRTVREPEAAPRIEVVHDDPDVLRRYAAAARPVPAEVYLDDRELLRQLELVGHETGLMRVGRKVLLTVPLPEPAGD